MRFATQAIDLAIAMLRQKSLRRDYYHDEGSLRQIASFAWPTEYDGGRFLVSLDKHESPEKAGDRPVATISWEFGTLSKYRMILAQCWLRGAKYDPGCDVLVWTARKTVWVDSWVDDDVD